VVQQEREDLVMRRRFIASVIALTAALLFPLNAQRQDIEIDEDEITFTGCISPMSQSAGSRPDLLLWSRGDLLLAGVAEAMDDDGGVNDSESLTNRIFYWLDDEEELSTHVGQRVEVRGELDDFEEGQIEIERDGDFARLKLDLDGEEEEARVPISWLGPGGPDHDVNLDFVARRIDVEDVRVLGSCSGL